VSFGKEGRRRREWETCTILEGKQNHPPGRAKTAEGGMIPVTVRLEKKVEQLLLVQIGGEEEVEEANAQVGKGEIFSGGRNQKLEGEGGMGKRLARKS